MYRKIIDKFSLLQLLLFLIVFGTMWGNFKIIELKILTDTNAYRLDRYGYVFDTYQYNRTRLTRRGKNAIKNIDQILQNQMRTNDMLESEIKPLNDYIRTMEKRIKILEGKLQQHEKNSVPRR